jgi:hypothetical protein
MGGIGTDLRVRASMLVTELSRTLILYESRSDATNIYSGMTDPSVESSQGDDAYPRSGRCW